MDKAMPPPPVGDKRCSKYFSNTTNSKTDMMDVKEGEITEIVAPARANSMAPSSRSRSRLTSFNELLATAKNITVDMKEMEKILEELTESYSSMLMEVALNAAPEAAIICNGFKDKVEESKED